MSDNQRYSPRAIGGIPAPSSQDIKFESGVFRQPEEVYYSNMHAINERLIRMEERSHATIDILGKLVPKIEEIHAFTVHKSPHLEPIRKV